LSIKALTYKDRATYFEGDGNTTNSIKKFDTKQGAWFLRT